MAHAFLFMNSKFSRSHKRGWEAQPPEKNRYPCRKDPALSSSTSHLTFPAATSQACRKGRYIASKTEIPLRSQIYPGL